MYFLAYFYYYFGNIRIVALLSYVYAAFRSRELTGLSLVTIIAGALVMIKMIESIEQVGLVGILYCRLYWGWIIFYAYFLSDSKRRLNYIWILPTVTCLEFILVYLFPVLLTILPNYASTDFTSYQIASGLSSGVHSFGGNRTVSSVILAALYFYEKGKGGKYKNIFLISCLLVFSGLGTGIIVVGLIKEKLFDSKQIIIKKLPVTFFISGVLLYLLFGDHGFERVKYSYFSDTIIDYKMNQIEEAQNLFPFTARNIAFGKFINTSSSELVSDFGITFGDFLALQFAVDNGMIGILAFTLFLISAMNTVNRIPIIVMVIGTLHYHVIFSMPGQIVFGYLLAVSKKSSIHKN